MSIKGHDMAELLHCPFCGGEARHYNGNIHGHGVVCKKCGAKVDGYALERTAKRAWNTRTPKERGE